MASRKTDFLCTMQKFVRRRLFKARKIDLIHTTKQDQGLRGQFLNHRMRVRSITMYHLSRVH